MPRVTADEYLEKWQRRTNAAGQDVRAGVERVTEAPGVKAAQAADRMLAGITESINNGKWQRAVAGVSLDDWKRQTIDVGIPRIAAGVNASVTKNRGKIEKLLSDVDAVQAEVDRMPKTTFQDRIQRMVAFSQGMHDKSQTGR